MGYTNILASKRRTKFTLIFVRLYYKNAFYDESGVEKLELEYAF